MKSIVKNNWQFVKQQCKTKTLFELKNQGYIKLFRKLIEWEWYDQPATKVVFIHCLLKANWQEKTWRGKTIKPGQFFTSVKHLSDDLGLSEKQIRNALKRLKKTGEICTQGASNGTMITVCNYDSYQENEKPNGEQRANEGRARGDNEELKESKEYIKSDFEKFWNIYDKKIDKTKCLKKWGTLKRQDKDKIFETLQKYIEGTPEKQFRKNALTYLNWEIWNDEEVPGLSGKESDEQIAKAAFNNRKNYNPRG